MSFRTRETARTLALLAIATSAAGAQYSTPVGNGAAKPKTLRATAVLEFTGSLEKPSASRLMPVAVWDGEHYQPAGLYLARPSPLALDTGTQYELERGGEPAGLLNVRAAAQMRGGWIGLAKFQPEAPPPPPPKLKPLKQQPVLAGGKLPTQDKPPGNSSSHGDRPTLHRKDDSAPDADTDTPSSTAPASTPGASSTPSAGKPADSSNSAPTDTDHPTLHRRTDSSDDTAGATASPSKPATGAPANPGSGASSSGSGTSTPSDPDRPTLHKPTDADTAKSDDDKPTLHRHDDSSAASKTSDNDPDRPTLHRARTPSVTSISIDPDRPHLRYGGSDETAAAKLPTRLDGTPPDMQQVVAVSDAVPGEQRPYQYKWSSPDDAAKMKAALTIIAGKAVAKPGAATTPPQFGPAARPSRSARRGGPRSAHINLPPSALIDEHFAAYELTFSGGATLVYSAHTAGEGAQRTYITIIAQPDFNGTPQVLLQQVTRADRLDETPAMQLVDAVDTDDDNRAELIFQLTGAATIPALETPADAPPTSADDGASSTAASSAASIQAAQTAAAAARTSAAAVPEREFAIYRVADRKAVQVFTTGPLP